MIYNCGAQSDTQGSWRDPKGPGSKKGSNWKQDLIICFHYISIY